MYVWSVWTLQFFVYSPRVSGHLTSFLFILMKLLSWRRSLRGQAQGLHQLFLLDSSSSFTVTDGFFFWKLSSLPAGRAPCAMFLFSSWHLTSSYPSGNVSEGFVLGSLTEAFTFNHHLCVDDSPNEIFTLVSHPSSRLKLSYSYSSSLSFSLFFLPSPPSCFGPGTELGAGVTCADHSFCLQSPG